jgi:glycosyltransferase involved in cell wall biosynthesis
MRVLVIGALPQSLLNFRGPLLAAMVAGNHQVFACANGKDQMVEEGLAKIGIQYLPITMERTGLNPFVDLTTCFHLVKLMRKLRPDVVLSYTIKPVVYSGLAARICSVPLTFSMITGLGHVFSSVPGFKHNILQRLVAALYTSSLKCNKKVFFMNPDDIDEFVSLGIIPRSKTFLINGTGVPLDHYDVETLPEQPVFLLIARLLAEKGIHEFKEAAAIVKRKYPEATFLLVGDVDVNPSSITSLELSAWQEEGVIEYLGYQKDVRLAIAKASVYVLPSYREGTPRTVLEAMAMGRPIIVSNAPGCRETIALRHGESLDPQSSEVIEGLNGYLVPVKSVEKLAEAMERFIENPGLCQTMGAISRQIAEEKYDVHKVNAVLLREMGLA